MSWVILTALLLPADVASAANEVRHTLSFPDRREQLIQVQSEFPVGDPVTVLMMPNWTPGSYQIKDYAANVNRISAVSGSGKALRMQKVSKDRWSVDTDQIHTLVVHYEVFTPTIKVNESWASRAFSLVNGASVFLYTEQTRDLPQLLDVAIGAERGGVFTVMPFDPDVGVYQADNYDELVDSPVAVAVAPA